MGASTSQGAGAEGSGASGGTSTETGAVSGTGAWSSDAGTAGTGGTPGASDCSEPDTAPTVMRRLSALEYRLTVQDLLGLSETPEAPNIPLDNERLGFRTFAEYQTMSAENLRGYLDTAATLADSLLADPVRREQVIGCQTDAQDCLSDFVARFGKLAFRRPLESEELTRFVEAATEVALDAEDRFAFVIEAFLSSSQFLYRVEMGDSPDGLSTLSPAELASKLSFALWGRGPTEAQLDAADAGALDTPAGLASVAEEMLADERTEIFFQQFFRQWLGYQTLKPPSPEEVAIFEDMQSETDALLEEFAWSDGNFLGALTADYTYVSPALAEYYGLPEPDFVGRVDFPAGHPRSDSGILTHASLLSAKSDGDLISIRGNWVRRTFLCEEIHLPPDLADTLGDLLVGLDKVGIVLARNMRTECVACHGLIDPIGVGFVGFARTGVFDGAEQPEMFSVSPALPLAPSPNDFEAVAGLSAQLANLPAVPHCLAERAYLYVNGREPTATDSCSVDSASDQFSKPGGSLRELLLATVTAPAFRLRRAPDLDADLSGESP